MGKTYMDGSFELLDGAHVSNRLLSIFKARHGSLAGCSHTSNGIEFDDAPFEAEEIIDAIAGAREALGIIITGYGHWYNSDGEEGSFEVDAAGNVTTYDADQWALHSASDEELVAELAARGFTISHASKKGTYVVKLDVSGAMFVEVKAAFDADPNEIKRLAAAKFSEMDLGGLQVSDWSFSVAAAPDGGTVLLS